MNISIVRYTVGRLLQIEAFLLLIPLAVSFIYQESWHYILSFLGVSAFLLAVGKLISQRKPKKTRITAKEGFAVVALSWVLLSFFGSLPFFFSGDIPSLVDAFFETSSGFTTTGSSILTDVETLSHSMLFWRSFTHLIGGMGILVFALAVLPQMDSESVHIMKAEVPGPTFGKLVSKLTSTARILYVIYLSMTLVVLILLLLGGMDLFDATLHAFGVAGTGGFGVRNGSIAPYNSAYIEYVISIGMLAFGVNFNLYYMVLIRQAKQVLKSEELRWYLGIVAGAILLIGLNLFPLYDSFEKLFRDVLFSVSSIITTTGFATADFGTWPLFSRLILLLLMFVGGSAGSTSGGLKVSRIVILFKTVVSEVKHVAQPNRIVSIRYDQKALSKSTKHAVANYILVYAVSYILLLLLISLDMPDFLSAFSAIVATLNNIGPGLGMVGPASSFAGLNDFSKILLSFVMLAGRLEIFPMIILFSPRTWKK
ncbi:MAG: TrkH family potassium uptake protein [Pisciglobus halotolerans]|nr:TrkH family potassium uptake protein [Pisciglobus halotolerans]